jgi:hypothetical protein
MINPKKSEREKKKQILEEMGRQRRMPKTNIIQLLTE